MNRYHRPEWRTQSRTKRKFYAGYLKWIERLGYLVVAAVFAGFVYAFNTKADEVIKADGVKVEAMSEAILASEDTLIVRQMVENYSPVKKGTPLFRIVTGAHAQQAFAERLAAKLSKSLKYELQAHPESLVTAPSDGVFILMDSEKPYAEGEVIAKIVDYSKLVAQADLEGATVGKAKSGQPARLSALTYSDTGIVFRGSSPKGDIVSGQFFSQQTKDEIEALLRGQAVKARDDVPLLIEGVKSIQVDASMDLQWGVEAANPILLDPAPSVTVQGRVDVGTHIGTLQTASLPNNVRQAIEAEAQRRASESAFATQETSKITGLHNLNTVIQVTVKGEAEGQQAWPATVINRKFQAVVIIDNPPPGLVQAVRQADRNGTAVTARVEVITGSRPLALTLLKK